MELIQPGLKFSTWRGCSYFSGCIYDLTSLCFHVYFNKLSFINGFSTFSWEACVSCRGLDFPFGFSIFFLWHAFLVAVSVLYCDVHFFVINCAIFVLLNPNVS